jgi:hypothetical protein
VNIGFTINIECCIEAGSIAKVEKMLPKEKYFHYVFCFKLPMMALFAHSHSI